MKILLPVDVAQRLVKVLKRRGLTETGGILMGEHVADGEFRIVDFTVQHAAGTFASFLRLPQKHLRSLQNFFRRTGDDYCRFNYLGEWHSHPAFSIRPSHPDIAAMQALVNDAATGANFAVLMIVRLDRDTTLQTGTYVFVPQSAAVSIVPLVLDAEQAATQSGVSAQPPAASVFSFMAKGGGRLEVVSNPDLGDAGPHTVS